MAGAVQAPPHDTVPPQPSAMLPQFMPAGHVVAFTHVGAPHTFAVPAPPQTVTGGAGASAVEDAAAAVGDLPALPCARTS